MTRKQSKARLKRKVAQQQGTAVKSVKETGSAQTASLVTFEKEHRFKHLLGELEKELLEVNPIDPIGYLEEYLKNNRERLQAQFPVQSAPATIEEPHIHQTDITLVNLPTQVLQNIFAYLPTSDLLKLSTLHSALYDAVNDPSIWKDRFEKKSYNNCEYICTEWPIWKVKYIQNYKDLPVDSLYTLESTFIASGRVEEISPQGSFTLIRVSTSKVY